MEVVRGELLGELLEVVVAVRLVLWARRRVGLLFRELLLQRVGAAYLLLGWRLGEELLVFSAVLAVCFERSLPRSTRVGSWAQVLEMVKQQAK